MNLFRRIHRRCENAIDHLAETAHRQTQRAEDAHDTLLRMDDLNDDLERAEHDLDAAKEQLQGLHAQFAHVLEGAYRAGMLYRTWALLSSCLGQEHQQMLDAAVDAARIPNLDGLALVHNIGAEAERCLDPFCAAPNLLMVRHPANRAARMLCRECGHHWALPRYLAPDLSRAVPAGPAAAVPLVSLSPEVLAAADAALPAPDGESVA